MNLLTREGIGKSIAVRSSVMISSCTIAILSLSVLPVWAESTHRYTGHIVNANCRPAAEIVNRNSRGYTAPGGVSAFVGARQKPLNPGRLKKAILKRCSLNVGVTAFALADDRGNFFRLDEAGNRQVFEQNIRKSKETTVAIEGTVERETLTVVSISKVESK